MFTDMTFLEMFPIPVALLVWSQPLANTDILFHIDNMAVVHILNNSTLKRKIVMVILKNNITIKAQ